MEEVVRRGGIRASRRFVGFVERDVIDARPFVHHQPRRDVDLLEETVGDAGVARPADRREVAQDRVVCRDQRGPLRGQLELVQIHLVAVAGAHVLDVRVGVVGDHAFAQPEAVDCDVSLPPREHRFALVLLNL